MRTEIAKSLRTLQSQVPALKPLKESAQIFTRRLLRAPHEPDFRAIPKLGLGAGSCFLDIGGNYGQSVSSILTLVPDARIISFEPNPLLAERLRRRFANMPNVEVHASGLGDRQGSSTLYVPVYRGYVYDGLASLDREQAREWLSRDTVYFFDPDKLHLEEITVEVRRLDDLGLRPDFVKIDVQGWEANVLQGGRATLAACLPVVLAEAVEEEGALMQLLQPLGYRRFRYVDGRLVEGGSGGDNSFLLPPERIARADPSLFA